MKSGITNLLKGKTDSLSDRQKMFLTVILLVAGILLIMSGSFVDKTEHSGSLELVSSNEYKTSLESQLEKMLSAVEGVGEAKVMITLVGENSKTIAYNESQSASTNQNSSQENTSKDAVLIKDGTTSAPYTLNESYPDVAGVLVVATGAEDSLTKSYIISAIKSTLNVSANNITVLPMSTMGK